jgi:hypothetical protein
MIVETIVTTLNADDSVHIAPMGIRTQAERIVIAPFKPSTTLQNLRRSGHAVINFTDDVSIFAGCLTGRYDWPTRPADGIPGRFLDAALVHIEAEVERVEDDELRPRFYCLERCRAVHGEFRGFNRAQAAVLEAAILVSRLDRLPQEQVDRELEYLQNAVDKTAGERERLAWSWLVEHVERARGTERREARSR